MKRWVLVVLVFAVFLTSCKSDGDNYDTQPISYNLYDEPSTLDPQIAVDSSANTVIMNVFEGLTRLDKENKVCPGAAESWESNQDKTSYTFYLRDNSVWNDKDKTPVTAHDFVFGIQRAVDKQTKYEKAETLYVIKNARKINVEGEDVSSLGVRAVDDYTISFQLEYECEDFPSLVSTSPFMPCNKKFFNSSSGKYGREYNMIITNGPFKIKDKYSWVHYEKLIIVPNELYKGPNKPFCAGVEFSVSQNDFDAVSQISNKKVDAVKITENQMSKFNQDNFDVLQFKNSSWGLFFNLNDRFFGNYDVRNAFLSAIDREKLYEVLGDSYAKTSNFILDTSKINGKSYRNMVGSCKTVTKNFEDAKSSMTKGLKSLGISDFPNVTILCPDDAQTKSMVSRMIQDWNGTFNAYLNMHPMPKDTLDQKVLSSSYSIAIFGVSAVSDDATDFVKMFRSSNDGNFVGLKDSKYDNLLDKIVNALSSEEKASNILSAENFLIDERIFYPLYNGSQYFVCLKNVKDIIFYPYDGGIDFTKAKKFK